MELADGMRRAGISDYVLALLDYGGESGGVIYRSAIYAAVSMHFADGRLLVPYTSPEYSEYDLLTYRASRKMAPECCEIGYPDKLRQMLQFLGRSAELCVVGGSRRPLCGPTTD